MIDPMHDMEGAKRTAEMAKRVGFEEVVGGICYTTSPVHTDEYFAAKVAELDACEAIDSVYLKDPAGLLTPDRVSPSCRSSRRAWPAQGSRRSTATPPPGSPH